MTDEQAKKVGEELANFLNLHPGEDGWYHTEWGTKTLEGLGRCIERIVNRNTQPTQG